MENIFFKKVYFIFLKIKHTKCFVDFNFELGQYLSKNNIPYAKKYFMGKKYEHFRNAAIDELIVAMYERKNWSQRIIEKFEKKRSNVDLEISYLMDLRVERSNKNQNVFDVKKRIYS